MGFEDLNLYPSYQEHCAYPYDDAMIRWLTQMMDHGNDADSII
jgi:hypothetical protein